MAGLTNVQFRQADIFTLPFGPESFGHAFVCFVLKRLSQPVEALMRLQGVLKPGGTMTVVEGDHGSTYFHPRQRRGADGDPVPSRAAAVGEGKRIDRAAALPTHGRGRAHAVRVSPRMVYVDASRPDLVDALLQKNVHGDDRGSSRIAITAGLAESAAFDAGVRDLYRAAGADGVFCYTFFKGVGTKPPD